MKTPFILLLHAHDYVWRSDRPFKVRMEATQIIWKLISSGV